MQTVGGRYSDPGALSSVLEPELWGRAEVRAACPALTHVQETRHTAGGNVNQAATEINMEVPQKNKKKVKTELRVMLGSAIPGLGSTAQVSRSAHPGPAQRGLCIHVCCAASTVVMMFVIRLMDKEHVIPIVYNIMQQWVLFIYKVGGNDVTCKKMDGTGDPSIKQTNNNLCRKTNRVCFPVYVEFRFKNIA